MAVLKKKYVDINDTLRHIRLQVKEGKTWAADNIPYFISPTEMYHWLRIRTTYKNDPEGIELLQSAKTLFDNNFHGTPGAGDCDCFTILTLTALNKQKWHGKPWIKLAGRNWEYPVHIWAGIDYKGEQIALDLTNRRPFEERNYKHIQKIYFKPL
jgi:hypothetical protein